MTINWFSFCTVLFYSFIEL